jgi:hypothetical protein
MEEGKEDKENFKGLKLYDDGRIKIHQAEIPDEHEVVVLNHYIYLGRGILRE